MVKSKSVAGGILCIIGAVMAFIGTLHLAICALVADATEAATNVVSGGTVGDTAADNTILVWAFGIVAFVLAIVGAVFCFKNNLIGGILSAVSWVALIVVSAIVGYWAWTVIVAIILLAVGTLLAFLVRKPIAQAAPEQQTTNNPPPQQ